MILDGYESLGFDGELEFDNKKIWEDIDCVIESLRKTVQEQFKSDYHFEKWIDLWLKIFPRSYSF